LRGAISLVNSLEPTISTFKYFLISIYILIGQLILHFINKSCRKSSFFFLILIQGYFDARNSGGKD